MRWIILLLGACCCCLSSVHASEETAENLCDALPGRPSPTEKTIALEQLPKADSTGNQLSVSLEQLEEIESRYRSFLKPEAVDPSAAVIRVYDADGEQFEERTMRFGSLPSDFVLDMRRQAEKAKTRSILEADPLAHAPTFPTVEGSPYQYAPIEVAPELRWVAGAGTTLYRSNPPNRCR